MKKYIAAALVLLFLQLVKAQNYSGDYSISSDITLNGVATEQFKGKLTLSRIDDTHYTGTLQGRTLTVEIFPNNGRPLFTCKDIGADYVSLSAGKLSVTCRYGILFMGMFYDGRYGDYVISFQGTQTPFSTKADLIPVPANPARYGDVYSIASVPDSLSSYYLAAPPAYNPNFHCGPVSCINGFADINTPGGKWVLVSASGKPAGAEVLSGDFVYLENQGASKSYMAVCAENAKPLAPDINTGNALATTLTRTNKWRIVKHLDQAGTINVNEVIQFQNADGYGGWLRLGFVVCVNYYRQQAPAALTTTQWKLVR